MKHVTMKVDLEIKFEMDDKRKDYDQAMQTALALAVEPNYHTIEEINKMPYQPNWLNTASTSNNSLTDSMKKPKAKTGKTTLSINSLSSTTTW